LAMRLLMSALLEEQCDLFLDARRPMLA